MAIQQIGMTRTESKPGLYLKDEKIPQRTVSDYVLAPDYYTAPIIGGGGRTGGVATPQINLGSQNVDSAVTSAQSGVLAAQKGTQALIDARPDVQKSINLMGDQINGIVNAGNNIGRTADALGQDILNVRQSAEDLRPYADKLQEYAGNMWNQGINLGGQGQDLLAQGNSLMNLNENAGGLVGEMVKMLGMIDPEAYVSMGAADVQRSQENARAQMERSLTRAGADASSLKTAAMQTQFAQALAGALAGAKTRLRVQGVKDRFAALGTAMDKAQETIKSGIETMNTALGYEKQASQNQKDAGDLIAKMGDLQVEAGKLRTDQGKLYGDQADKYAEAGALADKIGNMSIDYANSLVKAYGNETSAYTAVSEAQLAAAKFYQTEEAQNNEIALANQKAQLQTNQTNAGLQETFMQTAKKNKFTSYGSWL